MIRNHDRSGWFGASDTATIMGNWNTDTFRRWWLVKLGVRKDRFITPAMQCGTAYEHKILDALRVKTRDRQIRIRSLRLRVNYDGESRQLITEVKTHSKPVFKVTKAYWQQCQVEMFASGCGLFRKRKVCRIVAYRVTEDELFNFFLPIDENRLTQHKVDYDAEWVEGCYLPRLRYLAKCLRTGHWPQEEELCGR
jgi:hypothetical protein